MSAQLRESDDDAPAILYVDDESRSLKYFLRAFAAEFRILTASSAAEAERLLDEHRDRIGVLVTDQRMPVQTGVQLLARVKERHPGVVRVLTTAYTDMDAAVAAVNRGEVHRYILKPWDIDALRADLHATLRLHMERRAELDLLSARRQTMASIAAHMAHELSTPLATVASIAEGLERFLPLLLETYRRSGDTEIPGAMLDLLAESPKVTMESVNRSRLLISLMLMNTRPVSERSIEHEPLSIAAVVSSAMDGYPFAPGERDLVRIDVEDFQVAAPESLLVHVFYNLLKNALYAIRVARGGEIRITARPGVPMNRVTVLDTGCGIAADALARIFDEFYTLKGGGSGAGMGLSFGRRVLRGLGGDIQCDSRAGEYTRMELSFPVFGDDATELISVRGGKG